MRSFLVLLLSVFFVGCASAPAKKPVVYEAQTKVYKKSVEAINQSEVRSGFCLKGFGELKSKWSWKDAVNVANSCLAAKDYSRVEEVANELSTREPSAPWGPFFLAEVSRERGEFERALWMVELALKRAPEMSLVHYLKGQINWTKKDYGQAVLNFERATELDPTVTMAHLFLGQIYYRDQLYSKASKHFYAVLKMDSRNVTALSGLAESQLQDGNPRGALDAYSRLYSSNPKEGYYLLRMAEIYELSNDLSSALSSYRQLRALVLSGQVKKMPDAQLDQKIKGLELSTGNRAVASSKSGGSTK